MKKRIICALLALGAALAIADGNDEPNGWFILRWAEKPVAHGTSATVKEEDQTCFERVLAYDASKPETFEAIRQQLREGDVIAYYMEKKEARKEIFKGHLNKIGYRLLKYGHLAIVVQEGETAVPLRVFSSQSFKGPNTDETLGSLKSHSWHVYRLDKWDRVNTDRLHDFVKQAKLKAGAWYGYDFSGMFGLWNSNLAPTDKKKIGHDYICSTVVLAALHYSGVELDAAHHNGIGDLVSPKQVVTSRGHFIELPELKLEVIASQPTP